MKHVQKIDTNAKFISLKELGFPDYSPHEYPCANCGRKLKLYQTRVLYCRRCHKGFLHPRYDYDTDRII